ncbi:TIGR01620 family protein [Marinobacterium weihaiense]|uniref:TIGR01620 family protein n=1 Tax=Marinobacterium weihaiense TaxID=2851016 RepID=A0ABS6M9H7_9GAMM|nr:TIGR01620 family protein [Marinobacterium weihaiense]MBV0932930.1 TIGR01620 family protein [Marinobacterium weihaiense]
MSTPEHWQRPVELSPDALEPPSSSASGQTTTGHAQELPLESTRPVEVETGDIPLSPSPPARQSSRRWLWGSLGALLVTLAGAELYRLIHWGIDLHPLLGATFALLALVLVGAITVEIHRGCHSRRQLRRVNHLQQQASRLLTRHDTGHSSTLIHQLEQQYRQTPLARELNTALQQLDSSYSDAEIIRYLDRHALRQADRAAQQCVQRYSVESGVLVAVSPWASFDMLLVAWRNLRMLREISTIYGLPSGPLTQGRLLRQVLQNLAFAGASEMAVDAGSALLSSSITAGLSARAGQGLGAGLFTARTGFSAIELCRPLPTTDDRKTRSNRIATLILQRLGKGKAAEGPA